MQKLKMALYPLIMWVSKFTNTALVYKCNTQFLKASCSFFTLEGLDIGGRPLSFGQWKGKYLLIVNTASECGYTGQYADLEALQQQYATKLIIIGFPTNNFGGQEPGSNEAIGAFCKRNYGVTFPLMEKSVVKGATIHPVYQWLTQPTLNGWNKNAPTWNFCKYLISPEGDLVGFFGNGIAPSDNVITQYFV